MQALQRSIDSSQMLKYILKLGVTVCLLILIFNNIDISQALVSVASLSANTLLIALFLQLSSNTIAAYRWFLIMRRIGSNQNFLFFLQSYYKGAFFNQGLPTSIGGDTIRILDCASNNHSALDSFYGVFIDRFVGLAGLLVLNICALLFNKNLLPSRIFLLLLGIVVLLLSVLVILLFVRRLRLVRSNKWFGFLGKLSERYYQVYANPISIAMQLSLSIVIHLLAMTAFYVLGMGVGLDYPLNVYLVLVPPVILLTILPISLAGWGIREGAMIGFFLLIGADRSKVLTFSILYGLLALASSMPGLFAYLARKKSTISSNL